MAPLIRFDAVSVAFGEQEILTDATFTIEPGERVCLVGESQWRRERNQHVHYRGPSMTAADQSTEDRMEDRP